MAYVNPAACPECGSYQTEGRSFDIEVMLGAEWVRQERSCLDCDAEWYAWFKFHSHIIVEHGKTAAHVATTDIF